MYDISITVADTLRILVVIELALAFGLSLAILAVYFKNNHVIRKKDAEIQGTLVRHVLAIGTSYLFLAAFAIAEIQGYYGSELTWRIPIGFIASNLGIYALLQMLTFQRSRLDIYNKSVALKGAPKDVK